MLSRRQFLAGTGTLLLSEQSANADDSAPATTIYLTIDDGPTPFMKDIVDVLGDKDKVTFFLVGQEIQPALYFLCCVTQSGVRNSVSKHLKILNIFGAQKIEYFLVNCVMPCSLLRGSNF